MRSDTTCANDDVMKTCAKDHVMMMMIALTFLSAGSRGLRGRKKGRKSREVEERQDRQELRRQARTLPQVQLGQECWMQGTGENVDDGAGFHSAGGAEGLGISPIH